MMRPVLERILHIVRELLPYNAPDALIKAQALAFLPSEHVDMACSMVDIAFPTGKCLVSIRWADTIKVCGRWQLC